MRSTIFAAAAWTAAVAAAPALAADAATDAKARLIRPVTLVLDRDLNFGTILPSPTRTSTVRVNLNDTATPGGGAVLIGNSHHAARFSGSGQPGQILVLDWPANIFLTGPGPQMRARSVRVGTFSGLRRVTGRQYRVTSASGAYGFRLRATLNLARDQPPGDYVGSFTVTSNYQ